MAHLFIKKIKHYFLPDVYISTFSMKDRTQSIQMKTSLFVGKSLFLFILVFAYVNTSFAQGSKDDYKRANTISDWTKNKVFRDRVIPHWSDDGSSFWYHIQTGPSHYEFIAVDAVSGIREPAFNHGRVADTLESATSRKVDPTNLPFQWIDIDRQNDCVSFMAFDKQWKFFTNTNKLMETDDAISPGNTLTAYAELFPSRQSGTPTKIRFLNNTEKTVKIYWVNSDRNRRHYKTLEPGGVYRQNSFSGHVWLVTDEDEKTLAMFECSDEPADAIVDGKPVTKKKERRRPRRIGRNRSPDGLWSVSCTDETVSVMNTKTNETVVLSDTGSYENYFTNEIVWSPDSTKFVVKQIRRGEDRKVHIVESSPKDQLQPKLHTFSYNKPGDKLDVPRPRLFDIQTQKQIAINKDFIPNAWSIRDIHWWPDSSSIVFVYNQRGHQIMRVVQVDAKTGSARAIVNEQCKTFFDYARKEYHFYNDETQEIIWMSERDGWNHLYLYDAHADYLKNQITKGEWVVRGVERVDTEKRQIWFSAGGVIPGQDPYYVHLCRINFDGTGFTVLTEGDGTHQWKFSPDRNYIIDTWSRVDLPPITVLRKSDDGELVCELEKADWTELLATGWRPPERFAAKGRDGKTDIYGIIIFPSTFQPGKKYPVIENIYAGPHSAFVPKEFGLQTGLMRMAELGFVIVKMDGMGTSHRSKAFHDVCWKNLGDSGFPDRIAWIKAAAQKHPEMDLSRVGIFGGSAGGQSALRGLLMHGDFYHVGVADCGCHDNRMDKVWWNELWMGWPIGPHYEEQSNVTQAHRLTGKLMLIVGELDRNVDPASTMQVVNALIKADKDFDLIIVPGAGHGAAGTPYAQRRQMDFFVKHLLNEKPRWEKEKRD
jgi:dipeptidyl-peptidase-4